MQVCKRYIEEQKRARAVQTDQWKERSSWMWRQTEALLGILLGEAAADQKPSFRLKMKKALFCASRLTSHRAVSFQFFSSLRSGPSMDIATLVNMSNIQKRMQMERCMAEVQVGNNDQDNIQISGMEKSWDRIYRVKKTRSIELKIKITRRNPEARQFISN